MIKDDAQTLSDRSVTASAAGERAGALREKIADSWHRRASESAGDPFDNAVEKAVFDLAASVEHGEVGYDELDDLIQLLTRRMFVARAERLGAYVGEVDPDVNAERFRAAIRGLAFDPRGQRVEFDDFRRKIEAELFGIVLTAHPTFGISAELTQVLAERAAGRRADGAPMDDAEREAIDAMVQSARHGFSEAPPLTVEQDLSMRAIAHLQEALERIYRIVLEVSAEVFPEQWGDLMPRMLTLASWVGYDLDGRGDIQWHDTFLARMRVELIQLERYLAELRMLLDFSRSGKNGGGELRTSLRLVESRLVLAANTVREDIALLTVGADDPASVAAFNRRLRESLDSRLVDVGELTELLSRTIEIADRDKVEFRLRMSVLRSALANYGLAMAHTHFRVNATQLVNAARKLVGMSMSPVDHRNRRYYLGAINTLIDEVEPVTVNFGSVMQERQTARRVFMVIAQILKYVDSRTPIRFLIAECDTAFVVLTALYLAKLFGVEERLDISPLFETPIALQHGHEILADLLASPHYRAYVQKRGRICIQTGFSDAGRYLGQVAASLAIERLRIKIVELLVEHGLAGIELVIFDTHGESVGRGAHPSGFAERLDYIYPGASRALFACQGVPVKQEVSFQGGDGYVFFATPAMAFATLCRVLEHTLASPRDVCDVAARRKREDRLYEDTDYSLEFFITAKEFNERLMDDSDFAELLDVFGPNLLYPTGSRVVTRHHDGRSPTDRGHPSQIRAIPQNAILQQMGFLANSIGGLGMAIGKDVDRFVEFMRGSERARGFMALVKYADDVGDLDVLLAYTRLLDPGLWLRRAAHAGSNGRQEPMKRLAALLHRSGRSDRLARIHRHFLRDRMDLQSGFDAVRDFWSPPDVPEAVREDLHLLHIVRMVLIGEIFLLAARVPRFSNQPDITVDEVIDDLLHLQVAPAVRVLGRAFPPSGEEISDDFGEEATYRGDMARGYESEHRDIFVPMVRLHDMVRRVSAGIIHGIGAVG